MAREPLYDYVIVGSGAGGGTLAARLAEAGKSVFLLEAGGNPNEKALGLPEQYDVPAFHPLASENPAMSWGFSVRHYEDDKQQLADWKCERDPATGESRPGVFYPRCAALGGCTAHNAMIFIAPYESDWDEIAQITGDVSWSAQNMRRYLQRIESARYRPVSRFLSRFGHDGKESKRNPWLSTEIPRPWKAVRDFELMKLIIESLSFVGRYNRHKQLAAYLAHPWLGKGWELAEGVWKAVRFGSRTAAGLLTGLNPNSERRLRGLAEGICFVPLSTHLGQRAGARERVLDAAAQHPLRIEYDALATKIIFDSEKRAIGVEYLKGERLYRAHDDPSAREGERREVRAGREVILAGGAFNTPQLLMLSGIGPESVLKEHGIEVLHPLEGVGKNLQDRYEVGVVYRLDKPWESLEGAKFARGDRLYEQWLGGPRLGFLPARMRKLLPANLQETQRRGMYISNGAAFAFTRRSAAGLPDPDLFCMALLGKFRGYFRGYSQKDVCNPGNLNYLTFALLKAYTGSRGVVTLRSADPKDQPLINFRYFCESDPETANKDAGAIAEGIQFVREIAAHLRSKGLNLEEEFPGARLEAGEDLAKHVRDTAWGHHASCTCKIAPEAEGGVLSSDFKVHGVRGLRVADASVFPRIPGLFIVSAVYMIAEKAADVILGEAEETQIAH